MSFTPASSTCPSAQSASCPTVTYYQPLFQIPTIITQTNVPGAFRTFNGVEVNGRKRMSNHWLMNTSFSYNFARLDFDSFAGGLSSTSLTTLPFVEDPTTRAIRNGGEVETSGGQLGGVNTDKVSTSAAKGTAGTWLLDPTDVTSVSGTGPPNEALLMEREPLAIVHASCAAYD